jgi:hypothetical protein
MTDHDSVSPCSGELIRRDVTIGAAAAALLLEWSGPAGAATQPAAGAKASVTVSVGWWSMAGHMHRTSTRARRRWMSCGARQ